VSSGVQSVPQLFCLSDRPELLPSAILLILDPPDWPLSPGQLSTMNNCLLQKPGRQPPRPLSWILAHWDFSLFETEGDSRESRPYQVRRSTSSLIRSLPRFFSPSIISPRSFLTLSSQTGSFSFLCPFGSPSPPRPPADGLNRDRTS